MNRMKHLGQEGSGEDHRRSSAPVLAEDGVEFGLGPFAGKGGAGAGGAGGAGGGAGGAGGREKWV